ncbi:hypothetical protein D3C81_2198630 [compost metagenome]
MHPFQRLLADKTFHRLYAQGTFHQGMALFFAGFAQFEPGQIVRLQIINPINNVEVFAAPDFDRRLD